MSIALPDNKEEKWARYCGLIKQGSLTYLEAATAYLVYLRNTNQEEK